MPLEAESGAEEAESGVEVVAPEGCPSGDFTAPSPADPARVAPTVGAALPGDAGAAPPTAGAALPGDAGAAPPADPAAADQASFADIGEGDRALAPASVTAARVAGAIGVAVMSLSGLAAVLVAAVATPLGWRGAAGLAAAVLMLTAAGAAASQRWPAVRYRHIRYRLDAHGVTIRRGVVWRTVTSVPTSRVQHTDVSRGPVERYFDLATLVIHTAGTRDASVALSGLGHREAVALRDRLIEAGGDRGV